MAYAILYNISLILNDQLEDDEEKENLSNKIPMVNLEKIDNEISYEILSLNDCSDKILCRIYVSIYRVSDVLTNCDHDFFGTSDDLIKINLDKS